MSTPTPTPTLTPTARFLLHVLSARTKPRSPAELSVETGCSALMTIRTLRQLTRLGLVEAVRVGPQRHYAQPARTAADATELR